MCVIIYRPKGVDLKESVLRQCWDANSHGAGLMYAENGVVEIIKGLMSFDDLKSAIELVGDRQMVIHFRLASRGTICEANTHPFYVHDDLAIAHNGTIHGLGNGTESDTSQLAAIMSGMTSDSYRLKPLQDLIRALIYPDRLAMMFGNGDVVLLGEWHQDEGLEFSNMNWKNRTPFWKGDDDETPHWKWAFYKRDRRKTEYAKTFTFGTPLESNRKYLCPTCYEEAIKDHPLFWTCARCGISYRESELVCSIQNGD